MTEKILEKLMEQKETAETPALRFAAERSVSLMKAYCGLSLLPEALLGAGTSLALLLYREEEGGQNVKSIREGDVSLTFGETEGGETAEIPRFISMELDRYRRLNW